jgi:hypothetical protein
MDNKNIDLKIIDNIKKYIYNNDTIKNKFTHFNQKYSIDDLLKPILIILKQGISYRDIQIYTPINWNTIYKFYIKLIKYQIIENTFKLCVNRYLTEIEKPSKVLFTDSSLVINKLGIDQIGYNPQLKKHKTTKFSVITDNFGVPISIDSFNGSCHDALIISKQLNNIHKDFPKLFTNDKILIGDAAYDSNNLKNLAVNLNLGFVLAPTNIRNTKNITKIENNKYNPIDKMLLKSRICVEHIINNYKKFKKISIRYDKYNINYKSYLFLASIFILLKKTNLKL